MKQTKANFFPRLAESCRLYSGGGRRIDSSRESKLDQLASYINAGLTAGSEAKVVFICTHNSRRSQLAQAWFAAAAAWYGIEGCRSLSGGTEETRVYPETINSLERSGFRATVVKEGNNPHYRLTFGEGSEPIILFSKRFDSGGNPLAGFAAVMVCSSADEACPFVGGADLRVSLPFEDPGAYDSSPGVEKEYDRASRLIADEMFYLASAIRKIQ